MALVLDRFVFEMGLDPKDFVKGQRETVNSFRKTREAMVKDGQGIETAAEKAASGVDRLFRNFVKLFALVTTGRGLSGFVREVTSADAALGRLATSIGRAPELISAMSKAVERSGGDAQAAARSFQSWSEQVEQIRTTGDSSILPFLARLQAAGGKTIDLNKKNVDGLADLADNLRAVAEQQGIASATYYGKNLGFDEGTIALMVKGGAALRNAIRESEKLGIATKKDTSAAQELSTAYVTLTQEVESFGRTILTAVSPVLVQLLKDVQAIVRAVREWVQSNVVPFLKEFADSMGIAGSETKTLVRITEALFALWLGSKALAFLRVLGTMRLLLTGGRVAGAATAAASGGLLGAIMGGLVVGGAAAAANSQGILAPPDRSSSWHEGLIRALDPGLANRIYGPRAGGGGGGPTLMGRITGGFRRMLGLGGGGGAQGGADGGSGTPSGSSAGSLTELIDREAKAAGIDPRIMHGIRAGESHRRDTYDVKDDAVESSWGPFQLNRRRGLGVQFEKETGLDVRDPKTIPDQVRWVAKFLAKGGSTGNWMGYRGPREADPKWGNSGYVPSPQGGQAAGDVPGKDGVGAVEQRQQSGTRSQPVTGILRSQIAAAAKAAGVNAEIFSGGQDSEGPNRVGSHRHDHGNAADLKLYQIGPDGKRRYLRHDNEADRAVMETFLRESVKAGASGIGAGPGYMGPDRMHVGGGPNAAWGAGGSSANAPEWVSRALRDGLAARRGKSAEWWRGSRNAMASVAQSRDAQAAQIGRQMNDNRSNSTTTNSTHIGSVTVQTAATDASGIARDMEESLKRRSFVAAATTGQA